MAGNLTLSGLVGTLKSTFRINKLTLDTRALSSARLVIVPDKAGTLAFTSDLAEPFTAGTRLVFAQAAAPTGWVQITDESANNRMLRVVNTTGGSFAGSHNPILNNRVPAHTHGFTTGTASADHTHTTTTGTESADHAHYTTTGGSSTNHTHTFTGSEMAAHNHTTTAHSHTVPDTWSSTGGDAAPATLTGTGYQTTGSTSAKTVAINTASAGTPSGTNGWASSDHTHAGWSGGRNTAHTHTGTSGGISANHTHSGSTDNGSSSTNWTPRYLDTLICSKS